MSKTINGYYAKHKKGHTLSQFEWSKDNQLFLVYGDGTKTAVNPDDYDIVNMEQITDKHFNRINMGNDSFCSECGKNITGEPHKH